MKILKFSGIFLGTHLLALIIILANPGCSSSTKPAPSATETAKSDAGSSAPMILAAPTPPTTAETSAINAPIRYSPTRPNTPAASTLQAEPVPNVTPATTYTVVSGDNLTVIAKKNHLTIAELAAANNISASAKLHLGQKLIIPSKVAAPAKMEETAAVPASSAKPSDALAPKPSGESIKHIVKQGDTLSTIAKKYGVKQSDIAVANNITDPQKIAIGRELIIPGWQTPGSKPAKSAKPVSTAAKNNSDPKPVLLPPEPVPDSTPKPASGEVPVINVEDSPAPTK